MFEDLYLFCTYVIWVTFRRKEWERVKVEVGNMLRSKAFNPALQQKHYQPTESDDSRSNTHGSISVSVSSSYVCHYAWV